MSDTALIKASRAGQWDRCIQLLKRKRTNDLNKRGSARKTALMAAAEGGQFDIVELLLEKGSSTGDRDKDGNTLLMLASIGGNVKIVELFLSKGADINEKNKKGTTSIMLASQIGHIDVVKLLLSKGANPNDTNKYGSRSIMWAAFRGNDDLVKVLLPNGADIPEIKSWYTPAAKFIFKKWPVFMGIIVLQELSIYFILDASTIIDLCQYVGEKDELSIYY